MDAGEVDARQSRVTTARNHSRYDLQTAERSQREPQERRHREPHEMATATLLRSNAPHSQSHSYGSGYPDAPAAPSMQDMISPIEPRRPSDPVDAHPHRQSLPSLQEVISSTGSPVGGLSQPPGPGSIPGFQSSFSASPRPFVEPHSSHDKGPSSQPLHPASTYPPRPEPLTAFGESPRAHPFVGRQGPGPLNSFSPSHPSPPTKQDQPRLETDKMADQHAANGTYHHVPPIAPYSATGQLPQAPSYPVSPRHPGPLVPSPFDTQRGPPPRPEDSEHILGRARYDMTVNRQLDAWTYQEWLSRIASSSRTIFNFAEGYGKIAQEQHTSRPIPERLPTEREVADMLGNVDYIRRSLESVRDLVQQSSRAEIPREVQGKGPFEEEDTAMYDGPKQPAYGGATEVKKRRGRAAPPGRCHSCNRIDTPEWRRGPDGARTLCNACGLHYAKLERKRQLEARSIRPRQADEAG